METTNGQGWTFRRELEDNLSICTTAFCLIFEEEFTSSC